MADKKISQLTALTQADLVDLFPIVDDSASETKKITVGDLFASPSPIGGTNASTGEFTTLALPTGATISSFSTDTNLGSSDTAVPTQNAVKSYVDAQIGGMSTNKISQGDSSVEVNDTTSSDASITFKIDNIVQGIFDSTGLTLATGVAVSKFSSDVNLGSSDTTIPTQNAVKTYIDSQISGLAPNRIWQGDSSVVVTDTTSSDSSIAFTLDSVVQGTFDSTGLSLATGVSVNHISNDNTLTNASQTSLVTEYAVKQYIDNNSSLSDRIIDGLASAVVSDSTTESYFSVKVRDTYFGPDATTYTAIYYFDDQTSSNWSNPSNMVDGNTNTFAQAGSAQGLYTQINTGSTIAPSATRNVEKVEMRVYGRDGSGPNISAFNLYPVFNGSVQGNSQNLRSFLGPVKSWTPWIDITSDPYAPEDWTWNNVINLDTKIEGIIGSPGGGIGDLLEVNKIEIQVTYTESPSVVGSVEKLRVDDNGITTQYGSSVNEFSTDVTMADNSNNAIPTERAVKTYVDFQIQSVRNDLDLINIRHLNSDTTAVTGDVCLVNTASGVINIQMIEIPDGRVIVKKISNDSNPIYVSTTPGSSIDGETTFIIDTPYKSFTFLSDGDEFFII